MSIDLTVTHNALIRHLYIIEKTAIFAVVGGHRPMVAGIGYNAIVGQTRLF